MYYCHSWPIHRTEVFMHPSCNINILWVHEIPLVKQSHLLKALHTEEHETPLMIWHVQFHLVIKHLQQITVIHPLYYLFRQEPAE